MPVFEVPMFDPSIQTLAAEGRRGKSFSGCWAPDEYVRLYAPLIPINWNLFLVFRSLESQLFNKANEVQEDISGKRFDQKLAQIHLAAVRAQVGTYQKARLFSP